MTDLDSKRWLDAYGDLLFRYALARVGDTALAEDLVQETLLAASRARHVLCPHAASPRRRANASWNSCTMSVELGRLRWRCRRGMKELDLILERYLERGYPQADRVEQAAFARLLEASDPELVTWLVYSRPCPDPELAAIVAAVRACCG